ncbi:MAG: flagellar biosynthesis anti-sigma factor FlgM [Oscillospiraceae bacterium]|nr:flagellar biosynthesis anti-sigma factor FlgM [Oscillospiraceae bacterium]
MNIKINNNPMKLYEASKRDREVSKNGAKPGGAAASKPEAHDKITISREAKSLNILDFVKSKIKDEMDGDTKSAERVNGLKERLKNGEYFVSSESIAAAVLGVSHE